MVIGMIAGGVIEIVRALYVKSLVKPAHPIPLVSKIVYTAGHFFGLPKAQILLLKAQSYARILHKTHT